MYLVGTLYFAYQPGPPYSTLYLIYTQLADTSTHTLTHFPSECDFIITIVVASSFAVYFWGPGRSEQWVRINITRMENYAKNCMS